jgi:membrane-anchored protein YejM (alkaline phosphatase superfamily)
MLDRLVDHLKLSFYLCVLTTGAVALFLKDAPAAETWLPLAYQWSVAGYYGTVLLILAVATTPLIVSRFTRWVWPVLGWGWLAFLGIDLAVFNLYRFHLDWLLVEMFINDFRGMGIPIFLLVLSAVLLVALLALVLWLFASQRTGSRKHLVWFVIGLLLMPVGFMLNSTINIWAAHFVRNEITRYRPFLPIYFPVELDAKAKTISASLPSVFPAAYGKATEADIGKSGILRYPAAEPVCAPSADAPSILMIVLESWQADAMNAEITPNIARFSQTATRFDQHVSSGATTVPGLFGLMYGLHPNYFYLIRSSGNSYPSLFTETLNKQGYRTRVFTSSNLDGFSLDSLFFPRVRKEDFVAASGDELPVQRYIDSLSAPGDEKRFDFLFLTSSHSSYSYPEAFTKFRPLPAVEGGYALDKYADNRAYKNDYHNSLYYLDSLVGKLLAEAERAGKLKNTWVVITGDHAEEFNENGQGYWGHGSNFTRWQTQTPMIIRAPGQRSAQVEQRLSLHQDVVPTLMKRALGCSSPVTDYSNGADLKVLPDQRGTIISSYMATAYLMEGVVVDRAINRKYAWRGFGNTYTPPSTEAIRALLSEEGRFIQKPSP